MPVTVVQQDWGAALGYEAVGRWRGLARTSVPGRRFKSARG
jgi:hypothetical protein